MEDQLGDPGSMIHLARELVALRRAEPALRSGSYRTMETTPDAWAWSRGDRLVVLASFSDARASLDGITGTIRVATDARRRGEVIDGALVVSGWEAVVVERVGSGVVDGAVEPQGGGT